MIMDSAGNEYKVGAIVRIKHFRTKNKKYYMYKQVFEIDKEKHRVGFSHLPIKRGCSPCLSFCLNKKELENDTLIVQAYYEDCRDLIRNKDISD